MTKAHEFEPLILRPLLPREVFSNGRCIKAISTRSILQLKVQHFDCHSAAWGIVILQTAFSIFIVAVCILETSASCQNKSIINDGVCRKVLTNI